MTASHRYQIGSEEPRGTVGSRAARGETLEDALAEARAWSRGRSIKSSWVRCHSVNGLGPVLATFIKGKQVSK